MSSHILVFDSGIGGTTVLEHIQKLLPDAHLSYFMDNAYLPYGRLSQQKIIARLTALLKFIQREQLTIDVLVIACNTASTSALQPIRELTTIPIVGVVPAIKPAAALTKSNHIGLLATPATIGNTYTRKLIIDYAQDINVGLYSSVGLVAIAEKLYFTGEFDDCAFQIEMNKLSLHSSTDVLVLGCTHFPILAKQIRDFYKGKVELLDSGAAIAKRVKAILHEQTQQAVPVVNNTHLKERQKKPLHYYATASILTNKLTVKHIKLID